MFWWLARLRRERGWRVERDGKPDGEKRRTISVSQAGACIIREAILNSSVHAPSSRRKILWVLRMAGPTFTAVVGCRGGSELRL